MGELAPRPSTNSVNQQLMAIRTRLGYDRRGKSPPPPHACRRGAAEEIVTSGASLAAIVKSGSWAAVGYNRYIDLQRDEVLKMAQPYMGNAHADSEDDERPTEKQINAMTRDKG